MVITEFDAGDPEATMHALADEIVRYRLALGLLAKAVGWASTGAPFGFFPPGPLWRPRRTIEDGAPGMPDLSARSVNQVVQTPSEPCESDAAGGVGCGRDDRIEQ
jgi:hypothetical protein